MAAPATTATTATGTGSAGTRILGVASILLVAALVLFGLVLTDPPRRRPRARATPCGSSTSTCPRR